MDATYATKVTVVQPGSGQSVSIPGFGTVYKIYGRDNGGEGSGQGPCRSGNPGSGCEADTVAITGSADFQRAGEDEGAR
jgi:hypothetical protein